MKVTNEKSRMKVKDVHQGSFSSLLHPELISVCPCLWNCQSLCSAVEPVCLFFQVSKGNSGNKCKDHLLELLSAVWLFQIPLLQWVCDTFKQFFCKFCLTSLVFNEGFGLKQTNPPLLEGEVVLKKFKSNPRHYIILSIHTLACILEKCGHFHTCQQCRFMFRFPRIPRNVF